MTDSPYISIGTEGFSPVHGRRKGPLNIYVTVKLIRIYDAVTSEIIVP